MLENFDISKLDFNKISFANDYKLLPLVARNNYSLALYALEANIYNYFYIGDELKDNETLALKALEKSQYLYESLSDSLKNNPEIFLIFTRNKFYADNLERFQFGPNIAKDKSLMIRFIEKIEKNRYPHFLTMLDKSLLLDKEILLLAIDNNSESYKDIPKEMKTKEFCFELFEKNFYVFSHFEDELLFDADFTVKMMQHLLENRKSKVFFNYVTQTLSFIKKLSKFQPLLRETAHEYNLLQENMSIQKISDNPQRSLEIIDDTLLMSIKKIEAHQLHQLMQEDIKLHQVNSAVHSKSLKHNKF